MVDIYKGDCLEILPTIDDSSVDMIMADLPYGTTACKWDSIIPLEPLWKELNRISKPNAPWGSMRANLLQLYWPYLICLILDMNGYGKNHKAQIP